MGTTDKEKEKKILSEAGERLGKPKYLVSSGGCGWNGVGLNLRRIPPPTLGLVIWKAVVLGSQLLG